MPKEWNQPSVSRPAREPAADQAAGRRCRNRRAAGRLLPQAPRVAHTGFLLSFYFHFISAWLL